MVAFACFDSHFLLLPTPLQKFTRYNLSDIRKVSHKRLTSTGYAHQDPGKGREYAGEYERSQLHRRGLDIPESIEYLAYGRFFPLKGLEVMRKPSNAYAIESVMTKNDEDGVPRWYMCVHSRHTVHPGTVTFSVAIDVWESRLGCAPFLYVYDTLPITARVQKGIPSIFDLVS